MFSCLFSALPFIMQLIKHWAVNVTHSCLENWGKPVCPRSFLIFIERNGWQLTPRMMLSLQTFSPNMQKSWDSLFGRLCGEQHSLLYFLVVSRQLIHHRPLDPSSAFIWSLPGSVCTENCCYLLALQQPVLQGLNTSTQPCFLSMHVISRHTRSAASTKILFLLTKLKDSSVWTKCCIFASFPPPIPLWRDSIPSCCQKISLLLPTDSSHEASQMWIS